MLWQAHTLFMMSYLAKTWNLLNMNMWRIVVLKEKVIQVSKLAISVEAPQMGCGNGVESGKS